jgi:hypothetical protein
MPEYFVRTNSDRVICIEADTYGFDYTRRFFDFKKEGNVLASFNSNDVLAIIDKTVYQGEFSAINDEESEDLFREFLDSDEFLDAVYGVVEAWHEPDTETPEEAEEPQGTAQSADHSYPIEHWKNDNGDETWGFWTDRGFVYFSYEDGAEFGRNTQIKNPSQTWSYKDLTGYTKVED